MLTISALMDAQLVNFDEFITRWSLSAVLSSSEFNNTPILMLSLIFSPAFASHCMIWRSNCSMRPWTSPVKEKRIKDDSMPANLVRLLGS